MRIKDYCQYLTVSQVNYTLTNYADHMEGMSHDRVNRFLRKAKLGPRMIWERAKEDVEESENGYILFDDTVIDKRYSRSMELVRKQYSGNVGGIVEGIGVVTCVYVNPKTENWWIIDMRIYAPDIDGKTKLDHVADMLRHTFLHKKIAFKTVLMDSWYSTKNLVMQIEGMKKIYYCPIKKNRKVDDSDGEESYKQACELDWMDDELVHGKRVKLYKFPKNHKVRLFRVMVNKRRTEFVISNDTKADVTTDDARSECAVRWKIEQLHRDAKQLTGLEKCQCRAERIQRNHILCAWLVWLNLAKQARNKAVSLYTLKHNLLSSYLSSQLHNPSLVFA